MCVSDCVCVFRFLFFFKNSTATFMGYLMHKLSLYENSSDIILPIAEDIRVFIMCVGVCFGFLSFVFNVLVTILVYLMRKPYFLNNSSDTIKPITRGTKVFKPFP